MCAFLEGDLFERRGITPSRLGVIASGDPGFVRRCIDNGADVQLDTADTVRVEIGEPPFRAQFRRELERFMELTGMQPWAIGWYSVRNAAFVPRFLAGASPHLRTIDRVRRWMYAQLRGGQRRAVFGAAAGGDIAARVPGARELPSATREPARPGLTELAMGG